MPWQRTTLTELRQLVNRDIDAEIPGTDGLLRFSNLKIIGDVQANMEHLQEGYLDYIANQAVPFTATDEYLEAWAALKRVYRKPTTEATGTVTFTGEVGTIIPADTPLIRGDGVKYHTVEDCVISSGGEGAVKARADEDEEGLLGARGNCDAGVILTLGTSIAGVQSNGVASVFSGGADLESDEAFRDRMLFAFQNPPQGGSEADYMIWASEIPSVSRVWVKRNYFGTGTVVIFIMMDGSRAENNGFPVGQNGSATEEERYHTAEGDQLLVADHIWSLQPVTALVVVVAPERQEIDFTLSNILETSETEIAQALESVLFSLGEPGGRIPINRIWSAISSVAGGSDFVVIEPVGDIVCDRGKLPVVGAVNFV